MANPVLDTLRAQVEATDTVIDSATALINGFSGRLTDAVNAALANGATEAELAPITDEIAAMKTATDALAAAVVAGTPAATT